MPDYLTVCYKLVHTISTCCVVMFVAAPPLSVDQVLSVLGRLAGKWERVGHWLDIPETTRSAIKSEHTEDLDRLKSSIFFWLRSDPDASWRKLIYRLDRSRDEDFQRTADTIRKYAEKLSGQSVSHAVASCTPAIGAMVAKPCI